MVTVQSAWPAGAGRWACPPAPSGRPPRRACRSGRPRVSRSRIMQPSGVQGVSAGRPLGQAAGVDHVQAVDVLVRVDRRRSPPSRPAPWAGAAGPGCRGSPGRLFSSLDHGHQLGLADVGRQAMGHPNACRRPWSARPWSGHRPGWPGPRPPAPRPGPGCRPCSALSRATSSPTSARKRSAMALASMIWARRAWDHGIPELALALPVQPAPTQRPGRATRDEFHPDLHEIRHHETREVAGPAAGLRELPAPSCSAWRCRGRSSASPTPGSW